MKKIMLLYVAAVLMLVHQDAQASDVPKKLTSADVDALYNAMDDAKAIFPIGNDSSNNTSSNRLKNDCPEKSPYTSSALTITLISRFGNMYNGRVTVSPKTIERVPYLFEKSNEGEDKSIIIDLKEIHQNELEKIKQNKSSKIKMKPYQEIDTPHFEEILTGINNTFDEDVSAFATNILKVVRGSRTGTTVEKAAKILTILKLDAVSTEMLACQ